METKEIFERMATHYDTEERVRIANIIAGEIRSALANTPEKTQTKRALDYGCGTGLVGLELADRFASISLVDASPQMIEQVQKKIDSKLISNASATCADFVAEQPVGLQVDYVVVSQVLLHVKDVSMLLERLFDVIAPGGHLLVVDFDRCAAITSPLVHPGFDQAELVCLAGKVGFAHANAHTFYFGKNMFMNEDASLFLMDAQK